MKIEDFGSYDYEKVTEGLDQHDESLGNNQKWVSIKKIVVATEHEKQQLVKAFHYIHNLHELDTRFMAVNTIAHLYQVPDLIVVE